MTMPQYFNIFEDRLAKIRSDVKRLKKDKGVNKEHLRRLGEDAKKLRQAIKSARIEVKQELSILITEDAVLPTTSRVQVLSVEDRHQDDDGVEEMTIKVRVRFPHISGV